METIKVDGREFIIVRKGEQCPICNTPISDVCFSWSFFHGEAEASCCGAPYQIKDWYIEKPSKQMVKFMKNLGLNKKYIWLKIKQEWIKPLQKTLKKLGTKYITDDVISKAKKDFKL